MSPPRLILRGLSEYAHATGYYIRCARHIQQTECWSAYEVRHETAILQRESSVDCRMYTYTGSSFPKQMAGAWRVPDVRQDVSGEEP